MWTVARFGLLRRLPDLLVGMLVAPLTAYPIATEPGRCPASPILCVRKGPGSASTSGQGSGYQAAVGVKTAVALPTQGSLVNLHTHEILVLSSTEPTQTRFSAFLRDRVTGDSTEMAPGLLALLRKLTSERQPVRIEIISGYRSWKLNEMLRKKGHHVASHSQHSLGKAMDFRLEGLSAKQLARAVEALRWRGGLAYYPGKHDRFVHADTGPNRRWKGR